MRAGYFPTKAFTSAGRLLREQKAADARAPLPKRLRSPRPRTQELLAYMGGEGRPLKEADRLLRNASADPPTTRLLAPKLDLFKSGRVFDPSVPLRGGGGARRARDFLDHVGTCARGRQRARGHRLLDAQPPVRPAARRRRKAPQHCAAPEKNRKRSTRGPFSCCAAEGAPEPPNSNSPTCKTTHVTLLIYPYYPPSTDTPENADVRGPASCRKRECCVDRGDDFTHLPGSMRRSARLACRTLTLGPAEHKLRHGQ
jgi:hypothetical protein